MEQNHKSPGKDSPRPLPKVSAAKYNQAVTEDRAARMKWKLKGNEDGPIYQGQVKVGKCRTCP